MIINPTKKSLPLFNNLPQVDKKENGIAYSEKNPFFSWHANYYNVNRKKILVLVNDFSLTPVVLADINATSKKKLPELIEQGIRQAFILSGVTAGQLDRYFELAGKLELNVGHNRRVTGVTNLYIEEAKFFPVNLKENLQPQLGYRLATTPISNLKYGNSVEMVKRAFSEKLAVVAVTEKDVVKQDKKSYKVTKTWVAYSKWSQYKGRGWFANYEKVFDELQENNDKLLVAFEDYLTNGEKLSKKVVNRHVGNVRFFANEYLAYSGFQTVVDDLIDFGEYFSWLYRKDPWLTPNSLQQMAAGLKKLYTFLEQAGELSKEQLKNAKTTITEENQMTQLVLEEIGGNDSFYF